MGGFHLFEEETINTEKTVDVEPKPIVETSCEYLTFYVEEDLYAVNLLDVNEVIETPKAKFVPNCQPYFKGLFNLRGDISGLIDLGKKFEVSSNKDYVNQPTILFSTNHGPLGVCVTKMNGVHVIDSSAIQDKASIKTKISQKYMAGFCKINDQIVIIIDLKFLLDEDELVSLNRMKQAG